VTNVVVFSGGLDSTSVLALSVATGAPTVAVSFEYGQKHSRELLSARTICETLGVPHQTIDLTGLFHGSALLREAVTPVPDGHYAEDSMKATVIGGRNLLFAAVAIAAVEEGGSVWVGVHSGDHFVYPDCREEFWAPLRALVGEAYAVAVVTPFLGKSKAEALTLGAAVGAPYELSWSCYKGGEGESALHCGRCGTCVERAEAFHLAGIEDPTGYADPEFWRTAVSEA